MIAIGAEYSAITRALSPPKNASVRNGEVDDQPQRDERDAGLAATDQRARNAPAEAGALRRFRGAGVCGRLRHLAWLRDRVLLLLRAPLVARLRRQVRLHVGLRHERDSRVRVRRRHEPRRVLVEEELEDGQPALQVRLLVDREVQMACVDRRRASRASGRNLPPSRPSSWRPYFFMTGPMAWVEPASTANMPLTLLCPR